MHSDKGYGNAVHLFSAFTTISIVQVSFQILTKDSVTIYVNAIMYYRVKVGGYSLLNISTIICYKHLFSQASYLPAHYRTEIFMDLG